MHRTTIHIPERLWDQVSDCARKQGVSASQFIREAALAAVLIEQRDPDIDRVGAALEKARRELR